MHEHDGQMHHGPDPLDPQRRGGRSAGRTRRVLHLDEYVDRLVAEAPELNERQMGRLRSILAGGLARLDAATDADVTA